MIQSDIKVGSNLRGSVLAEIEETLGADAIAEIEAAVGKAFVLSRLSAHPGAKLMLQQFLTSLLAAVVAAPDNVTEANANAHEMADFLVLVVEEMLSVYAQGEGS